MARKGGKKHLKRLPAPAFWPIGKKITKWAIKPKSGPHNATLGVPLAVILRDALHLGRTGRESKLLLSSGKVKVDGRIRTDHKYPVGLMDVVEVPEAKMRLRMVPVTKKKLSLIEIPREEISFKLCKIEGKTTVAKGNVQLNLHDARNLIIKIQDARNSVEDSFSTGDTIQISLPEQQIMRHLKLTKGSYVVVTGGGNVGRHGKVANIEPSSSARPAIVEVEGSDGENFRTMEEYVFVVGEGEPIIKLGEL
jgi:small subunit ribosomal protein S4e